MRRRDILQGRDTQVTDTHSYWWCNLKLWVLGKNVINRFSSLSLQCPAASVSAVDLFRASSKDEFLNDRPHISTKRKVKEIFSCVDNSVSCYPGLLFIR